MNNAPRLFAYISTIFDILDYRKNQVFYQNSCIFAKFVVPLQRIFNF